MIFAIIKRYHSPPWGFNSMLMCVGIFFTYRTVELTESKGMYQVTNMAACIIHTPNKQRAAHHQSNGYGIR